MCLYGTSDAVDCAEPFNETILTQPFRQAADFEKQIIIIIKPKTVGHTISKNSNLIEFGVSIC